MYAKLVTKAGSPTLCGANSTTNAIANVAVWFNTMIDVITGTITNVNSVNSTVFDTSLCEIISTVAPGWELNDNTASNSIFVSTPAAPPVVIRAPYTDNASAYKYLWVSIPANTFQINSHGAPVVKWIPIESWDAATNTATNGFQTLPVNASASFTSNFLQFNDSPGTFMAGQTPQSTPSIANGGLTTIISASQSHLFIWNWHDQFGTNTSNYLGSFLVSEYSRDDAWNTAAAGWPSWGMWGSQGNGHTVGFYGENGTVIRVLNPNTGQNSTHLAPYTSIASSGYNYTFKSALSYYGIVANSGQFAQLTSNNAPGVWGRMGTYPNYPPNNRDVRNSSNNASFALGDIRIVPTLGISDGFLTTLYGLGPIAYGSITQKSPYIYLFKSQYQNLDEFVIDGTTYVNLRTNNNSVITNSAFCTTVLVKKV